MSANRSIKAQSQQKRLTTEVDARRSPLTWAKVEEFLREYARDLSRVGEYPAGTGRGAGVEMNGPAVFLESGGAEKRAGVVAPSGPTVPLSGGRQRLLVLELRENGVFCRLVRNTEHGLETGELAMELPPGCAERTRLERIISDAVENGRNRESMPEEWEGPAERLALALGLMLALARAGRRVVQESSKKATWSLHLFERVVAILKEKHREDLPLPMVAETIGLSPRHFSRLLEQWSGTGFTEHLLMVRLLHARQRLTHGRATVEEIADAAGFGSRDHFIRAFRQYFGWTPLQFRKKWRAASEGREKWESVLRMPDRNAVEWLPANTIGPSPEEEPGHFHTLVIANATSQVRVLHRIGADGAAIPEGVLQPGEVIFIHRAANHGMWRVANALAVPVAVFRSSGPRALAMITG